MIQLKVAVVVEGFPKLSETFVMNHIKGLIDGGVQVRIFALVHQDEDKVHALYHDYRLADLTRYKPVLPVNKLKRIAKGVFLCLKYGFRYPRQISQSLNFFQYGKEALGLAALFEVATFLTKEKFDIVHCHFGPVAVKLALYQRWGVLAAPLVTSFHGYDVDGEAVRKQNPYQGLIRQGALYISNSAYTRERLLALGFPEQRIRVLPVYFDTQAFRKKQEARGSGGMQILTVGRLVEFKGVEYALRALALVKNTKGLQVRYHIVGTGPLQESLQKLSEDLGLKDEVVFLGNRNQQEVIELMDSSQLFVLTGVKASDGRVENQGLVIQEAQAMEIPVIVSDIGGVREGMIDGETGFLVRPGDTRAIADKIIYLLENPAVARQMGKAGRQFVGEKYSIGKATAKILEYYRELLPGSIFEQDLKTGMRDGG